MEGSRRELDGNPTRIAARFWPPGFFSLGGSPGRILARFSQGSEIPGGKNLAVILAGKRESWWPKSRRDPTAHLVEILAGKHLLGGQNLAGMLPRISARSLAAKIKARS